jgi:hypothetical protein
MAITSGLVAA